MALAKKINFSQAIIAKLLALGFVEDNSENADRNLRQAFRFYVPYNAVILAITDDNKFLVDVFGTDPIEENPFEANTTNEALVFELITRMEGFIALARKENSLLGMANYLVSRGANTRYFHSAEPVSGTPA